MDRYIYVMDENIRKYSFDICQSEEDSFSAATTRNSVNVMIDLFPMFSILDIYLYRFGYGKQFEEITVMGITKFLLTFKKIG